MNNKEKCIECNSIPENVLVLSCSHCICLECASNKIQKYNKTEEHFIQCNQCGETTEIDDDVYHQLNNLVSSKIKKQQKKNQQILNKDKVSLGRQYYENKYQDGLERMCGFHPEYAIMYVCKTCNDIFICPECLINGSHKNHESNVIQRQGQKIKSKLQHDLSKIDQKISQLEKMQYARVSSIQQRKKEMQRLKSQAIKQYQQIRQAITREENTVLSKCNQLISSHQKELEEFKRQISNQVKSYQNQRIDIIDLINPLLEQSIIGQSRALQKMIMINLVESYRKFTANCQIVRQNFIKVTQQRGEQDLQVIQSLTRKIDRISMHSFFEPKQEIKRQCNMLPNMKKKHIKYPIKLQNLNITKAQDSIYNQSTKRQSKTNNNDFFTLL